MPSKKNAADVHVALQPARPPGTSLGLLIVVMVVIIAPLIALSQVIAYWRVDVVDDQMLDRKSVV